MNEDRIAQFEEEISGLRVRGSSADTERWLRIGAVVGLVGGVLLVVAGGILVSGTTDDADQRALAATSTMIGIALTIAGTALYVRVSFARMLRYWLVRLVHEHRTETDRIVAAIEGGSGASAPGSPLDTVAPSPEPAESADTADTAETAETAAS